MRTHRLLGVCVVMAVLAVGSKAAWAWNGNVSISPSSSSGSPVDLGSVDVGSTTPSMSFTIHDSKNGDHGDLTEATSGCTSNGTFNLKIGGTTATSFSNLSLDNDIMVAVTYTPSSHGTVTCKIKLQNPSNSSDNVSFFVTAKGTNPASAMLSSTSLMFGSVRDNAGAPVHSASKTITVTNGGDDPLAIMMVQVTGSDFSLTSGPTMTTIAGGGNQSWTITFQGTTAGAQSGMITFQKAAAMPAWGTATLAGTVTAAKIAAATGGFASAINVGSTPSVDVTIDNSIASFQGPLGVTQASIALTTAQVDGSNWFSFSSCNGVAGGTTCTFAPALSICGTSPCIGSGIVGVTCAVPAAAADGDAESATVSFTSDTDSGGTSTVSLTCTAGRGQLAATDTAGASLPPLTFMPQLVGQQSSQQLQFEVTNTSSSQGATFYLTVTNGDASSFAAVGTGGCGTDSGNQCSLPNKNDSNIVTVTFTPGVENSLSATVNVIGTSTSAGPITPAPQITLTGLGIDKHINVIGPTMDANAFRNPGTAAPIVPVTVQNTGRYMLTVTGTTVSPDPVWSIAPGQGSAFTVPAGDGTTPGTSTFNVAFSPTTSGRAPDGTLTFTSDDTRMGDISTAMFSGNGLNRDVAMGPAAIELGETGAGIPIRLSVIDPMNPLTVTNNDAMNTFHIREFQVTGDPGFSVAMPNGDPFAQSDIVNGSPQTFDVVFSPPDLGDFNGTIELFLDQDPVPQAFVPVHGSALFVGAHGGGCDTGGGGGTGGAALALGALIFGRSRRRRRA